MNPPPRSIREYWPFKFVQAEFPSLLSSCFAVRLRYEGDWFAHRKAHLSYSSSRTDTS